MVTTQERTIAVLWNGSSGWADSEEARQKVEAALSENGSRVRVRRVERGMDVAAESEALVEGGPEVLVAAGGDGTVNAAASALINKRTALAVIPAGTLNHFARDLNIPLDTDAAAQVAANGSAVQVDVGSVNGRIFINNAVLGFFPNYRVARRAVERHGLGKTRLGRFISSAAALWRVFWRMPHVTVSFKYEGRVRSFCTPFVLVGNNEHRMEGTELGTRERLDSGALWVYALPACTRWQLLMKTIGLLIGRVSRESMFHVFSTPEVSVTSKRRRIGVGIDGEMAMLKTPLEFKSLPLALRVITPGAGKGL